MGAWKVGKTQPVIVDAGGNDERSRRQFVVAAVGVLNRGQGERDAIRLGNRCAVDR